MAETQKPRYIEPKVIEFKPILGDLITRPTSNSTLEYSYDPEAILTGAQTYKYAKASLHPVVQPALKFLVEGPFWSEWSFHPDNDYEAHPEYEEIDNDVIKLINYQIDNMGFETFNNVLKSLWKDSLVHGYAIGEFIFKHDGTYWCVSSIKTHSPQLFDIYTDEGFNIDRLFYRNTGLYINRDMLPKFIVTTYPYIEHGRHYGTSILKSILFDVKLIEVLEQSYAEGTRRLAIKPIILHYRGEEMNEDEVKRYINSLYNLDSGSLIAFPADQDIDGKFLKKTEIEVLEDRASPDGTALIKDLLDILYKRINRSLGLPDDLGFSTTNIGSLAKAQEEMNLYTQTIANNQAFIECFVNKQIIPTFVKYNYPSLLSDNNYKFPKYQFGTVEEEYDAVIIQSMMDMIQAGILSARYDLAYIRERLGLPAAPEEMVGEPEITEQPGQGEQAPLDEGMLRRISRQMRGYV